VEVLLVELRDQRVLMLFKQEEVEVWINHKNVLDPLSDQGVAKEEL
jgi:hypothetical protein